MDKRISDFLKNFNNMISIDFFFQYKIHQKQLVLKKSELIEWLKQNEQSIEFNGSDETNEIYLIINGVDYTLQISDYYSDSLEDLNFLLEIDED